MPQQRGNTGVWKWVCGILSVLILALLAEWAMVGRGIVPREEYTTEITGIKSRVSGVELIDVKTTSDVEHLKGDVGEIKADVKELLNRIPK